MASRLGPSPQTWTGEGRDVIRAMSGGLLVGVPLIYTMEVWWIGVAAGPLRVLAVLVLTLVPVFILNRTSGFRRTKDVRVIDALMDAVEAVAISLVCATGLLVLLREISLDTSLRSAVGKIVYEAAPLSLGVGLARHFLGDEDGGADAEASATNVFDDHSGADTADLIDPDDGESLRQSFADVGATLIGAFVIAFAIAPTDEVPSVASAIDARWLIAFVVVSLIVSYGIVFEAGFASEQQRHNHHGIFQSPVSETVVSYLAALLAAWAMLWFFDRIAPGAPWFVTLTHVVVLGLPAAVGGAAGRLAV
jgi:putative integral membrane protein (TIGR02587 family)